MGFLRFLRSFMCCRPSVADDVLPPAPPGLASLAAAPHSQWFAPPAPYSPSLAPLTAAPQSSSPGLASHAVAPHRQWHAPPAPSSPGLASLAAASHPPAFTAEDYIKEIDAISMYSVESDISSQRRAPLAHNFSADDYIAELADMKKAHFSSMDSTFRYHLEKYFEEPQHTIPTASIRLMEEQALKLRSRNEYYTSDGRLLSWVNTQGPFQHDIGRKRRQVSGPFRRR